MRKLERALSGDRQCRDEVDWNHALSHCRQRTRRSPWGSTDLLSAHTGEERCTRPSRSMCSEIKEGKSSFSDSAEKMLWPLIWANTCCSHPFPEETSKEAGERRLREEMGFSCPLREESTFVYRAEDPGRGVEHEHVTLLTANVDAVKPVPNPAEVVEWKWIDVKALQKNMQAQPESYAPWFHRDFKNLRSMKHLHLAIIPDGNRRWAKTAACCPGTAMKSC